MRNLDDITNSQIAYFIDEYIHSERDREILKLKLIDGYTYSRLADIYHPLTEGQIQNIVYKQVARMHDKLGFYP